MPVEIRELHIKAIVENNPNEGNSSPQENNNESGEERIIKACVERVMEIIKAEKER